MLLLCADVILFPSSAVEISVLPVFMFLPGARLGIICPSPVLGQLLERQKKPEHIVNPVSCSIVGFCIVDKCLKTGFLTERLKLPAPNCEDLGWGQSLWLGRGES